MAKVPTQTDVERAFLDVVKNLNVRANEIFKDMTVRVRLDERGFRATEINDAIASLKEKGWISDARPPHLKLTDSGFDAM